MTNNHKNFDNYIDFKKTRSRINIIPTNWKKFGEVYSNELEQPVFICLLCFEKADSINTAFNTSDGSAFWWHIQKQHIDDECETLDQISEEIRNFETNGDTLETVNNEENPKIKEQHLKALEIFHDTLVRNNEVNDSNSEINLEDEKNIERNDSKQIITANRDVKIEIKQEYNKDYENKFSNCNYYYDNETYIISDDDDDDYDESDDEEIADQSDVINGSKKLNYLKHNDTIEISDDEMDTDEQDKVITRPNTPSLFTNEETNDVLTTNKNPLGLFNTTTLHNIEDNNVYQQDIIGIPTPEASPCESLGNALLGNNFNNSDYNSELGYECTQSLIPPPKKRAISFRAYQCKMCGIRTVNEKNMLIHQYRRHNNTELEARNRYHQIEQPYQNQEQGSVENRPNLGPCKKPFRCKSCKRGTATEKAMERHQQLYHNPDSHLIVSQCELCHKRIFKDKLQRHMYLHTLTGFKCNYCSLVYKGKSYLNLHINKYHSHENSMQMLPFLQGNTSSDFSFGENNHQTYAINK